MRKIKRLLACMLLIGCVQSAYAGLTFSEGVKSYEAGDFANARLIFERLAELGHRDAQYNLAAIYYAGQGVTKDSVKAYGWFYLAGESGDKEAKKLSEQIYKKLSPVQQIEAIKFRDSLVGGYSQAALNASLLPELTQTDLGYCQIKVTVKPIMRYPRQLDKPSKASDGWVDIGFTISKEGYVKDIFVLESSGKNEYAKEQFERVVINAFKKSKYAPPLVDGRNVEVYGQFVRMRFDYMFGGGDRVYRKQMDEYVALFLQKAREGDAYYQYLYAYLMSAHPDLSIENAEMNEWYLKSAQGGYGPAQYSIALSLLYGQGCVPDNAKAMEWLTKSAQSDYALAQLLLGRLLLKLSGSAEKKKGLFWVQKAADNKFVPASMALAWILATSGDQNLRNPEQALKLAEPVYKDYADQVTAFETMAAVYAATADFKQAVKFQQDAINEAKDLDWNVQSLQLRLDAYTNGKAWFES